MLTVMRGFLAWVWGVFWLGAVLGISGSAHGAGLVFSGPSAEGADAAAPQLSELLDVRITAELGETSAQVNEVRTYRVGQPSFEPLEFEGVFYRSLLQSDAGIIDIQVTVDGAPLDLSGELLDAADADERRRDLLTQTRATGPLRELGLPMFVSEPVALYPGASVVVTLTTESPLAKRGTLRGVSVPLDWHERNVGSVGIDVSVDSDVPLGALYSPYHELDVLRESAERAQGSYSGYGVCSRFDVTLLFSTSNDPLHLDLLPFRYGPDEAGSYIALLTPSFDADPESTTGRDIVLALDVSGSMLGEKLAQAKQALAEVIAGLSPKDTLSLVSFSSLVTSLGSEPLAANQENRVLALDFVEELAADGGTNIAGALETAFDMLPPDAGRPRYVVLLTDGQPTEGITDVDAIAELAHARNEGRARLFSFGIGNDVNTVLLDRLAKDSGGRALYVRNQSVDQAVSEFFAGIADPVLANPAVEWRGIDESDSFPRQLPDLFRGQTLTLVGRYGQGGKGQLTVTGQRLGERLEASFDIELPDHAFEEGYVPRLWALRKVGEMLEGLKLDANDEALKSEVFELARRYGVVTEFTYFRLDENDDLVFEYSEVPTDAVGATAVNTSASIDGYSTSSTAGSTVDAVVRYFRDRNFPRRAGYHTDAALDDDTDFVDVRFGSDLYFELASEGGAYGAYGFLSIARDMKFEHLGRSFRITDPERAEADVPEQATALGEPAWTPEFGSSRAELVAYVAPGGPEATSPEVELDESPDATTLSRGCAFNAKKPAGQGPASWVLAGVLLYWGHRRRQPSMRPASSSLSMLRSSTKPMPGA